MNKKLYTIAVVIGTFLGSFGITYAISQTINLAAPYTWTQGQTFATTTTTSATTTNFAITGITSQFLSTNANGSVIGTTTPNLTNATVSSVAMTTPTGLSVSGSPITTSGTFGLTLTSGYNIPLTASTTSWNNSLASTTALNGVSPITYNGSTGAIGCSTCNTTASNVINVTNSDGTLTISPTTGNVVGSIALGHANTWTGGQTFTSASTTNFAITGITSQFLATNANGSIIGTTTPLLSNSGDWAGTWQLHSPSYFQTALTFGASSTIALSNGSGLVYLPTLANSYLANSTISGISLGSNLATLSTDSTLSMAGGYNGSTTRTVGLNLGNANTWTGTQTFNNGTYSALFTGGNVGIGTTSPSNRLEVSGNTFLGGNVTATGTLSVAGNTTLAAATTTSLAITGLANTFLAVNGNGSVIATTTPAGGSGPTIAAGTNITISEGSPCSSGTCTINASGGGGGSSAPLYFVPATSTTMTVDFCSYASTTAPAYLQIGVAASNIAVTFTNATSCKGGVLWTLLSSPNSGTIGSTTFAGSSTMPVMWPAGLFPGTTVVNGLTDWYKFTSAASTTGTYIGGEYDNSF